MEEEEQPKKKKMNRKQRRRLFSILRTASPRRFRKHRKYEDGTVRRHPAGRARAARKEKHGSD